MAKVRKIGTIWKNLREFLNSDNPGSVAGAHPLSMYYQGPHGSKDVLVVALNRHTPFYRDELDLPASTVKDTNVGDLFSAIQIRYEEPNGWSVEP